MLLELNLDSESGQRNALAYMLGRMKPTHTKFHEI